MKTELNFHSTSFGHNYKVEFFPEAKITLVHRYFTNGHSNSNYETTTLFTIANIITEGMAERVAAEGKYFLTEEEISTAPTTIQGAMFREKAIRELLAAIKETSYVDDTEINQFERAIANCKI